VDHENPLPVLREDVAESGENGVVSHGELLLPRASS
jgi:hypothetical protein